MIDDKQWEQSMTAMLTSEEIYAEGNKRIWLFCWFFFWHEMWMQREPHSFSNYRKSVYVGMDKAKVGLQHKIPYSLISDFSFQDPILASTN